MTLTAIVLAGGRSSRFGSDKLAEPVGDTTMLAAVIEVVGAFADGVIVAGAALPDGLVASDVPIALVHDAEPFGGPLVALQHVLAMAEPDPTDVAVVVAGDMPRLVPGVLVAMVESLRRAPAADAVYLGTDAAAIGTEPPEPPRRQVLPLAIRVQPASRAAREAVEAGHRSLQSLVDRITAIELPAATWRALDPDGLTLLDVDTPADLDRIRRP